MKRKMRRFKQQLNEEESIEILCSTTSGVLSLCGEDMHPYGVPLSHVYANGNLYFHSALNGYKLDLIRQNDNVSFTVIAKDEIHPDRYTTYFLSVIVFGKIRIIENEAEKKRILEILGHRCNAEDEEGLSAELKKGLARCVALEMTIDHLTGKQAIELIGNQ
ncbi:MAG: pyridoxamine 5'-phosphate oxidase family protein [Muribaculaceae bacterium]|nr:pyridoxamine 5'-phosphate oxidase family protein [Muribaculaceae bacterium]